MNKLLSFAFVSSAIALASCTTLRANTVGHVGCGPDEMQVGPATSVDGVETWTAWCPTATYHCARQSNQTTTLLFGRRGITPSTSSTDETICTPEIASSSDPDPPPPRATPDSAPPSGAAGFSFHAALAEAAARCKEAGKTWSVVDAAHATCDGVAASVGFDATTDVELCGGEVCGLTLVAHPSGSAPQWLAQYGQLRKTLEAKYGDVHASSAGRDIDGCTGAALQACILDGRVRPETLWHWQSGESLWLVMSGAKDGSVVLRLRYRDRPEGSPRVAL